MPDIAPGVIRQDGFPRSNPLGIGASDSKARTIGKEKPQESTAKWLLAQEAVKKRLLVPPGPILSRMDREHRGQWPA